MPEDEFMEEQEQFFEEAGDDGYSFDPDQTEEISMDEAFEHSPEGLDSGLLQEDPVGAERAADGVSGEDGGGFKFPQSRPILSLPPIPPIPVKKKFNFKDPDSRPNRNQLLHHKRLCRKLGVPSDIADQVALLFYSTKQLLSDRMDELNLIIAFEEMMGVRPGSMTDILRMLHYRVDAACRKSQTNLREFEAALREGRDVKTAVEAAKSPPVSRVSTAGPTDERRGSRVLTGILGAVRRVLKIKVWPGIPDQAADPRVTTASKDGGGNH